MNKNRQRGAALLFALGMLTILLITGMAFVANALTAQKVAVNNSTRSQARIFAQSALSRVLASLMLYQYRELKSPDGGELPDSYDAVKSYGTVNSGAETDDGLTGSDSLLKLPNDNSIVSQDIAKIFNEKVAGATDVKWVYFYNKHTGEDRKIIGRAAWKVISVSPQISAPVFLSGMLPVETDPATWYPAEHRWGREIDEVNFTNNALFKHIDKSTWAGQFTMKDYNAVYTALGINSDDKAAEKRFIDRWFIPDADSNDFLGNPTAFVPEVYACKDSDNGKFTQMMRFNISELSDSTDKNWNELYGVSASADQWYARFGIDSTTAAGAAECNNDDFINKRLTADSIPAVLNDKFDHQLDKDDRPTLPFLRRIGDVFGTFADITAFRKQIAANFNDYCDKDSIPTSDVKAEEWLTEIGTEYKHPTYTGNEKTPYIYELGVRLGIFADNSGNIDLAKNGISVTQTDTDVNNQYNAELAAHVNISPIIKLANVYEFDPAGFTDFTANADFGELELKFKPHKVTFEVTYTYKADDEGAIAETKTETKTVEVTDAMSFNELTGTVADNEFKTATLAVDAAKLTNTGGSTPYPLLASNLLDSAAEVSKKLTISDANITYALPLETFKTAFEISGTGTTTIQKVTLKSIDAVKFTSVKFNVKRVVLAAKIDSKNTGLDYVKPLTDLTWTPTGGAEVIADIPESGKFSGIYIGGICNYDPRQNLNPGDWYKTALKVIAATDIKNPLNDDKLDDVMKLSGTAAAGWTGAVNRVDDAEENKKFNPNTAVTGYYQDRELATEPAWKADDKDKHLSTAFIRNAPMMSPWEIGFIHRASRWQTINIQNACDPDNNSSIKLTGHKPHGDKWDLTGTRYSGGTYYGDAAILDQIKMTDKCVTYGKINVNHLRKNDEHFTKSGDVLEHHIIKALFENVHCNESVKQFFINSTRDNNYTFPAAKNQTGDKITDFDKFSDATREHDKYVSRADFIACNGGMVDAFGAASPDNTDAAQEEIIGKTVNLLCADTTNPSQIKVVIVAQVIKDIAGEQIRPGDTTSTTCDFAQFDIGFDEIVGEVKMLATVEREGGRMVVRRIDYLE